MTVEGLAEPAMESVETLLRDELAQGDAVLSAASPVLRHLLAHDHNALFSDEVVARTRGMLTDLATQLLDAVAEAASAADPALFLAERRASLLTALAQEAALLAHLHATALEGMLALRIEGRTGIDPVSCPMLQELVASHDEGTAAMAMAVLAAQARFILHHREMTMPLRELPSDHFRSALRVLQSHAGQREEASATAARNLGQRFDESHGRLGLLAQLLARVDETAAALDLSRSGVSLFVSALASASEQERDFCLLALADGHSVRPSLAMRAAGLGQSELESQLLHLDMEISLPGGFAELTPDRAALLLQVTGRGE